MHEEARFRIPGGHTLGSRWFLSDTHLHPEDWFNVDDDPEAILRFLGACHPDDRVYFLGDLTESLLTTHPMAFQYALFAPWSRARPVLTRMRRDPRVYVVLGNHDIYARESLERFFGAGKIVRAPAVHDGVLIAHGHERSWIFNGLPGRATNLAIQVANPIERFVAQLTGFSAQRAIPQPAVDVAVERSRIEHKALLAAFGHTHRRGVHGRTINTGRFLRNGPRTAVHVAEDSVTIYRISPLSRRDGMTTASPTRTNSTIAILAVLFFGAIVVYLLFILNGEMSRAAGETAHASQVMPPLLLAAALVVCFIQYRLVVVLMVGSAVRVAEAAAEVERLGRSAPVVEGLSPEAVSKSLKVISEDTKDIASNLARSVETVRGAVLPTSGPKEPT